MYLLYKWYLKTWTIEELYIHLQNTMDLGWKLKYIFWGVGGYFPTKLFFVSCLKHTVLMILSTIVYQSLYTVPNNMFIDSQIIHWATSTAIFALSSWRILKLMLTCVILNSVVVKGCKYIYIYFFLKFICIQNETTF